MPATVETPDYLTAAEAADLPRPSPSPLIDRLSTPEGRACAIAMLRRLREEGDVDEQCRAWEVLKDGPTPLQLRRWPPDEGQAEDGTTPEAAS